MQTPIKWLSKTIIGRSSLESSVCIFPETTFSLSSTFIFHPFFLSFAKMQGTVPNYNGTIVGKITQKKLVHRPDFHSKSRENKLVFVGMFPLFFYLFSHILPQLCPAYYQHCCIKFSRKSLPYYFNDGLSNCNSFI